jgi:signal transduction histidine kinase
VLGHGWSAFVHAEDLPRCDEHWRHSLATGDDYEIEFRLRRHDGVYLWHLGRAQSLRNEERAIVHWFGTNTEIDELRRARESLRAQAEFEQHLLGIVSHDLRTPLNVISLGATVLADQPNMPPISAQVLLRIQSAARRGTRMVEDLMDFTQARLGGRLTIRPRPANLHEIVDNVLQDMLTTRPGRTIRVTHKGDGTGRWDPDRVAQLLINLISNAAQYGDPHQPIDVTAQDERDHVLLKVHNQGAPIPPQLLPDLFKPMQRGTKAASTERSVGLGLYIVDEIVKGHGGSVDVESNERGTMFSVRLPRMTPLPNK